MSDEVVVRLEARPVEVAAGKWRVMVQGRTLGPDSSERVARGVAKWMNAGGLSDLAGDTSGEPKLARVLTKVDEAWDAIGDLFRNGLR